MGDHMDNRVFFKELIGVTVEFPVGSPLGELKDMVIDTDDGAIRYLIVSSANKAVNFSHKEDDEGNLVIEVRSIHFSDGRLVIEPVL